MTDNSISFDDAIDLYQDIYSRGFTEDGVHKIALDKITDKELSHLQELETTMIENAIPSFILSKSLNEARKSPIIIPDTVTFYNTRFLKHSQFEIKESIKHGSTDKKYIERMMFLKNW